MRLTAKEFSVLEFFLRHPGQVLSQTQILNGVWEYDFDPGSNIVEVYVGYLRHKLDRPGKESIIETVRGGATGFAMSRLSLRLRLTISYSAIVAVVVLVGVGLTLFFMRGWLLRPIDREIVFQVNAFAKAAATAQPEAELPAASRDYLASSGTDELRNLGYTLFVWTSPARSCRTRTPPSRASPRASGSSAAPPASPTPRTHRLPHG